MKICARFITFQARTLRLLANAFVEMDSEQNWQKALNAVGLANMVSGGFS